MTELAGDKGGSATRKVVVCEFLHEEALELLARNSRLEYDPDLHLRREELTRTLQDADGLVVRNQTWVSGDLVAGSKLRAVGRIGVGLDNLDLPFLRAAGITATYAPGSNATSVAEYAIGAVLLLSRRLPEVSAGVHRGGWDRQGSIGIEIQGKTLGIIGLGDIGTRVARRAVAMGMKVIATDPALGPTSFGVQELGADLVPLPQLLAESDFVSLHTPLLESTRGMIGSEALALMKPGACLINSARGGIVDEQALARALREKRLAGAALDVRNPEPPGPQDPLAGMPNVLLTPHIAGVTEESMRRACLHVARDVVRILDGAKPQSEVPADAG